MSKSLEQAMKLIAKYLKPENDRRTNQQIRYNLLTDNVEGFVRSKIRERFGTETDAYKETEKFLDLSCNSFKYFINILSTVYHDNPVRTFKRSSDEKLFKQAVDVGILDLTMERINQLAVASNEAFAYLVWRRGKVEIDILPAHICEVSSTGLHLDSILFPIDSGSDEKLFCYWDNFKNLILDEKGNIIKSEDNIYGEIPVIPYRTKLPINCFWNGTDGNDLVESYIEQVVGRSWVSRIFYNQSYQQVFQKPHLEGQGDSHLITQDEPTFGPNQIPKGEFATIDLRTDTEKLINVLETKLRRTANNHGISSEVLNQQSSTSGLEKLLSQSSLQEHRKKLTKFFKPADLKLMKLVCRIWNAEAESDRFFGDDPEPAIDYAEANIILSKKDELEIQERAQNLCLASPIDFLRKQNPDLTEKDAQKKIIKNIEDNLIVQEAKRSFQIPANQDVEKKTEEGKLGGRPEETAPKEISEELERENVQDKSEE